MIIGKMRFAAGAVCLIVCGQVTAIKAEDPGVVRCLAIGIENYDEGELVGCAHDVAEIKALLPKQFGPARTSVVTMVSVKGDAEPIRWSAVRQQIATIAAASGEEDYFYFYYSGHGDQDALTLPKDNVTADDLGDELQTVSAKLTCVIIDACHSGSLIDKLQKKLGKRQLVIAAAVQSGQTAKTCLVGGQVCPANTMRGSVFTRWLTLAMSDPQNDRNGDGVVSWKEASLIVKDELRDKVYTDYLSETTWFQPNVRSFRLEMTPQIFQRLE